MNDLHDALLEKQSPTFWKCWRSKFEKRNRAVDSVNGVTDHTTIADNLRRIFHECVVATRYLVRHV